VCDAGDDDRCVQDKQRQRQRRRGDGSMELRLGIDVACRAAHQASLADDQGKFIWSGWKFTTTTADLEKLWAKVPDGAEVTAVMEPTRNAWVPLAGCSAK
jgi:hypothetical protein